VKCFCRHAKPLQRILDYDKGPRLVFLGGGRVPTAVQNSGQRRRRDLPVLKSPDALAIPKQLKHARQMAHLGLPTRMKSSVLFLQIRSIDMRIDLRGRDVRVAQHFLNGRKIRPMFE